jgi:NAD(P)H-dependent flavin oxidoreductase YrpB (nitropropane dioxygenase family)
MDYMGVGRGADPERTFMPAGQGMGLIREIKPAAEVVRDVVREAEEVLVRLASRVPIEMRAARGQSTAAAS